MSNYANSFGSMAEIDDDEEEYTRGLKDEKKTDREKLKELKELLETMKENSELRPVTTVQLDGLVLLQIIRHCEDALPEFLTGTLQGLDVTYTDEFGETRRKLEVTNSFPSPMGENETDASEYHTEIMTSLRDFKDNNVVGWYQSNHLSSFFTTEMIQEQYDYQVQIPESVHIVYDPKRCRNGNFSIKAYRLTNSFMETYKAGKKSYKDFAKLNMDSTNIFEDVPIKIHNSFVVHAFLYDIGRNKNMACDIDRLHLRPNTFLEKSMEALSDSIDEYAQEQGSFQFEIRKINRQNMELQRQRQKREEENEVRKRQGKELLSLDDLAREFKLQNDPSRLESFVIANQIEGICDSIIRTTKESWSKIYAIKALQRSEGDAKQ